MAFNPKYSSVPLVEASGNIGMPALPIILPYNEKITQSFMGDTASRFSQKFKGGNVFTLNYTIPYPTASQIMLSSTDIVAFGWYINGATRWTLPYVVEAPVFDKKDWCKVTAYDTTRYNYSTYPIVVFFKAFQRKIEQQNVVVKYDDEVGTIIPLSQKQFDVLTFTTQPMNSDYARLLLDVAEWDNVTFQHWDTENNAWSTSLNVAKKAEAWQKTTYPKTLGTTIQGSFIIKQ